MLHNSSSIIHPKTLDLLKRICNNPFKALTYFEDLDPEIDPPHMVKKIKVNDIKERLTQAVKHPEKLFSE